MFPKGMSLVEFVGYAKKFCVALVAALGVAAVALASNGGIDPNEWIQIIIAFLGALGVYATPNERINE